MGSTKTIATTDQDDSISEAIPLGAISSSPTNVDFVISPDTDVDMFGFVVTAGQIVDFDIDTITNGTGGLNSYLRLFNSQGLQLDFNNNAKAPSESTVGFDAYLRHTFAVAGTYFIGVSNASNILYNPETGNGDVGGGQDTTGSYRLILRSLSTTLSISINPISIPEKNGTAVGTVSRFGADLSQALVVNLSSSDVTSATVPASIIIPANQTSIDFTITALDNSTITGTKTVTISATAVGFTLGIGTLNITDDDSSWHNLVNSYDVDGDNTISPLDVLTIINYLNTTGSGPVGTGSPPPYLDVDSDNFVSPLDALVVINFLNAQNSGQGEAESANTAVPIEFIDDYFSALARNKSSTALQRAR